jgi:hypothetical protein
VDGDAAAAGGGAAAVDAVIAVLCYLATVALPLKVFREGGWPLFVLAALASITLAWRRRAPVAVAALIGAGALGLAVTGTIPSKLRVLSCLARARPNVATPAVPHHAGMSTDESRTVATMSTLWMSRP